MKVNDLLKMLRFIVRSKMSSTSVKLSIYLLTKVLETEENKFYITSDVIAKTINSKEYFINNAIKELIEMNILEIVETNTSSYFKFRNLSSWKKLKEN